MNSSERYGATSKSEFALRVMTRPGAGARTALAYVLIIGTPERLQCKQIGSYVG